MSRITRHAMFRMLSLVFPASSLLFLLLQLVATRSSCVAQRPQVIHLLLSLQCGQASFLLLTFGTASCYVAADTAAQDGFFHNHACCYVSSAVCFERDGNYSGIEGCCRQVLSSEHLYCAIMSLIHGSLRHAMLPFCIVCAALCDGASCTTA